MILMHVIFVPSNVRTTRYVTFTERISRTMRVRWEDYVLRGIQEVRWNQGGTVPADIISCSTEIGMRITDGWQNFPYVRGTTSKRRASLHIELSANTGYTVWLLAKCFIHLEILPTVKPRRFQHSLQTMMMMTMTINVKIYY